MPSPLVGLCQCRSPGEVSWVYSPKWLTCIQLLDAPKNYRVLRVFLEISGRWALLKVWGVESEEKQWEYSRLRCTVSDKKKPSVSQTVVCLWGSQWSRQIRGHLSLLLEQLTQLCRLICVKITGKVKEHDPHSASCFVQVRQSIFIFNPKPQDDQYTTMDPGKALACFDR